MDIPNIHLLQVNVFYCTDCGRRSIATSRIQKGRKTSIEAMPWMIGIGEYDFEGFFVFCSGFIVSQFHAITAAHCVQNAYVSSQSRIYSRSNMQSQTLAFHYLLCCTSSKRFLRFRSALYITFGSTFWTQAARRRVAGIWTLV